jgi:hypothetical protein
LMLAICSSNDFEVTQEGSANFRRWRRSCKLLNYPFFYQDLKTSSSWSWSSDMIFKSNFRLLITNGCICDTILCNGNTHNNRFKNYVWNGTHCTFGDTSDNLWQTYFGKPTFSADYYSRLSPRL